MSVFKKDLQAVPASTLGDYPGIQTAQRSTGTGFHLIARKYPTGDVEITSLQLGHEDSLKNGGGAKRENNNKADMNDAVLNKSVQRAKTQIRRKCLSMQCDRLLTLTFRENLTDIDDAWGRFKYFIKLMRWRYGSGFQYVAVPEYQKRGAVHFHLAVRGYFAYNTVRRFWHRAAGMDNGAINFTKKKSGKQLRNPSKIAGYIAKYLSKDESAEFNRRRYSSGGKIEIPAPLYGWLGFTESVVYHLCELLACMTHSPVRRIWEADGRFPLVHIST